MYSPDGYFVLYPRTQRGNLLEVHEWVPPSSWRITKYAYGTSDTCAYITKKEIQRQGGNILTEYGYDFNTGNRTSLTYYQDQYNSYTITYEYDVLNRLEKKTYPDYVTVEYKYDKRGNVRHRTVSKYGVPYSTAQYFYDALDHLTEVWEQPTEVQPPDYPGPYDYVTTYRYNLDGRMIEMSDTNDDSHNGSSNTTITYSYQGGRLSQTTHADGTYETYDYDDIGNLVRKIDRKGQKIAYEYSDDNWLVKKDYYPDSQSPAPEDSVIYIREMPGLLREVIYQGDTTRYDYHQYSQRLKIVETTHDNRKVDYLYEYLYHEHPNAAGNRTNMRVRALSDTCITYQNIGYYYDEANRCSTLVDSLSDDRYELEYWDTGELKKLTYSNGTTEEYVLTPRNFVDLLTTKKESAELFKYDYEYNELGDRRYMALKVTQPGAQPIEGTVQYTYDCLRRLTGAQYSDIYSDAGVSYQYDGVGNRLQMNRNGIITPYVYGYQTPAGSDDPNELISAGNMSYQYDANGNLITRSDGTAYAYDYENRLASVENASGVTRYYYNADGLRIRRVRASEVIYYLYDGINAIEERTSETQPPAGVTPPPYQYIYAGLLPLARIREGWIHHHYYAGYREGDAIDDRIANYNPDPGFNPEHDAYEDLSDTTATKLSVIVNYQKSYGLLGGKPGRDWRKYRIYHASDAGGSPGEWFTDVDVERKLDADGTWAEDTFLIYDSTVPVEWWIRLDLYYYDSTSVGYNAVHRDSMYLQGIDYEYEGGIDTVLPGPPVCYHHDALGSVVGMTDESGNVIQSYIYDEFGNLIPLGEDENEFTYTGQEWDGPATGLYYYGARYYDPTIGRFITPDSWTWLPDDERNLLSPNTKSVVEPVNNPQVLNRYVYCVNNPLDCIDPIGHGKLADMIAAVVCAIVGYFEPVAGILLALIYIELAYADYADAWRYEGASGPIHLP